MHRNLQVHIGFKVVLKNVAWDIGTNDSNDTAGSLLKRRNTSQLKEEKI